MILKKINNVGRLFGSAGALRPDRVWLSVKALAGPCRTEPTIVTEVGLRRITIFGTGFYYLIKSEVNIDEL